MTTRTRTPRPRGFVRITIDLDPAMHKEMKRWAVEEGTTISEVARLAFRRMLDHPPTAAAVRRMLDEDDR